MSSAPPQDPNANLSQEVFGPYLVYERLGVGGMATVHRAKERGIEGFERIVALKRLLPHLAEDASFVKSFVREAKLASMLQHANIVQLYELGRVGTTYFISMEHIDGRDVRRILRQARKVSGPPNINVTLALLIQLCDALEYAHTRQDENGEPLGLVHRDVSPSNLLVTKSGHLKVIDFGIAKAQSQQLRTQTGRVKGKLAYMAPEAISGKELDSRSDIFSVGVIAHELLTARPLFASKNEYQTLINVQRSEVLPPSAFNQAVPPELDAIVLKALARDPDERYLAAAQMRDDLHGVRIRYNLSATNREVQTWCDWAFALEAPGGNFSGPVVTDSFAGVSRSPIKTPVPLPLKAPADPPPVQMRARSPHDDEDADVAWGGGQEQDSGQPVVLDDVPDVGSKSPAIPRGMSAGAVAHAAEFAANEPQSASTLVGLGVPPRTRGHSSPSIWPHGSSSDAITGRRTARHSTSPPHAEPPGAHADETAPNPREDAPAFGAAIVEQRKGSGAKIALGALVAVAAIGGGVYFALGRGDGKQAASNAAATAAPAAWLAATLKFIVEPADATIKIAGMDPHQGSPWSVPLDPGVVQIKVSRDGHQSWETSVELSSGENQTVRVVLAQAVGDPSLSTLELTSTPAGLGIVLDGQDVGQRTPWKTQLPPGPHILQLRDEKGGIAWKHSWNAEARTLYTFNPSMDAAKQKERVERERQAVTQHERQSPTPLNRPVATREVPRDAALPPVADNPGADDKAPPPPPPPVSTSQGSAAVAGADSVKVTTPTPAPPTPTATATRPVTTPTAPVKPAAKTAIVVPPNAVKRTSGDLPKIKAVVRPGQEVPKALSAKICINETGAVTSVQVLKLTGDVAQAFASAIRDWRYTPYKDQGVATPACFVNSFALK